MDTIKFACPITLEEFQICDGILLDTKYYSLQSMRTWLRRKSTVPHTRRELTTEERETITDGVEFSDDDYEFNEYSGDEFDEEVGEDVGHIVNGSLPEERDMRTTMSWDVFERYVRNAPGYFNAKEIDSLVDAVITVYGVELVVNIKRQYVITNGEYREQFVSHIHANGCDFFQEEIIDHCIGDTIIRNVHDYIIRRFSIMMSLISSALK